MKLIPAHAYSRMIKALPILCVDVVIRNNKGEYLLIRRANEPLKNRWWVVGGRVLKGETLEKAAIRKVKQETGLVVKSAQPIGFYEDVFEKNHCCKSPLHSVSVVFSVKIGQDWKIRLDKQSWNFKFSLSLPKRLVIKPFIKKLNSQH
ncbi:MAG: NUDIX domain-containing protein [Candidatus Omnitrophica bacterium]|nr:NUDIX domain-containing protein [Candidatus Omnitrophota bacterium]